MSETRDITVEPAEIVKTLERLKGDGYASFIFMTCVDHLDSPAPAAARFELVYRLRDMDHDRDAHVRTYLDGDAPRIATVSHLYTPANWDEREVFDLFGIRFEGHPNLTRILMPDEWEGHPLRRDFPVGGEPVEFSEEFETYETAPQREPR